MDDVNPQFLDLCKKTWAQKKKVDALKAELKTSNAELTKLQADVNASMEQMELGELRLPELGLITRLKQFSTLTPKTPEDKQALFDWIRDTKGEDVLLSYQSIAASSLKAFYTQELELAKERNEYDFSIPGIQPPKAYYRINMTKA